MKHEIKFKVGSFIMLNKIDLIFSSPDKTISNFKQVLQNLLKEDMAQNAYHLHIKKLNTDKSYDPNIDKIIHMSALNFQIQGVSFKEKYVPLKNYNYPSTLAPLTGDILNAFTGNIDYNSNITAKSAMIAFIAESARSQLVRQSFMNLIRGSISSINLERQKNLLYTSYAKVCTYNGYLSIDGKYTCHYKPLVFDDYQRYYNSSQFTGDKKAALQAIEAILKEEAKA